MSSVTETFDFRNLIVCFGLNEMYSSIGRQEMLVSHVRKYNKTFVRSCIFILLFFLLAKSLLVFYFGKESLQEHPDSIKNEGESATSGRIWAPETRHQYKSESPRDFIISNLRPDNFAKRGIAQASLDDPSTLCCLQWAVVTTIFNITRTISQLMDNEDWCVVIVADKKTPPELFSNLRNNSVFLSVEAQKKLNYRSLDLLPWNHFGRKNIGYLFAVQHCAQKIYDTDDDNELIVESLSSVLSNSSGVVLPNTKTGYVFVNPYPSFMRLDANTSSVPSNIWPRGFPLNLVKDTVNRNIDGLQSDFNLRVSLIQSLADGDPDVDAIYRMTQPWPISFRQTGPWAILNTNMYSPLNAQALMVSYDAFFGLLLPVSVHGRVSDIWRAYLWRRLLKDIDKGLVAFAPPWVRHNRNSHSYEGDFTAETPLYSQSRQIVDFIENIQFPPDSSIPENILTLYVECYKVGILGLQDVELLKGWLIDLHEIGYWFPSRVPTFAKRTIWTSDLHDGVRVDHPSTLLSLGQQVINSGFKQNKSPYPWVLMHENSLLNPNLAPLIKNTVLHTLPSITEQEVKDFFSFYQSDPLLQKTDAFLCSFPMSFCEAYMPFNRSILFLPVHRFAMSRCSIHSWRRLVDHLQVSLQDSVNRPKHFLLAGGRYDAEYINYYTGLSPPILQSNSLSYVYEFTFSPSRAEILVGPLQLQTLPFKKHLQNIESEFDWKFATAKELYGHYSLDQITTHRAAVLFPYAVLSYGVTELYALGIPLFVPSIEFSIQLDLFKDRRIFNPDMYCKDTSNLPEKHPGSSHLFSPEDPSEEAKKYWIKYSDVYVLPHITTFSSWADLAEKLAESDFIAVHNAMMQENYKRKQDVTHSWTNILSQIESNRSIPGSYQKALQDLWGVDQLMT